ncbi:MAG TPA: hypothetical protein VN754_02575, partial [Candidatus Binataceae bacterium]|nr:hypothetical protein [Candidatus Binataceae bacterium]
ASKVEINPGWTTEPADAHLSSMGWATATAWAAAQSNELNATAAKFAIASAAATLATVISSLV